MATHISEDTFDYITTGRKRKRGPAKVNEPLPRCLLCGKTTPGTFYGFKDGLAHGGCRDDWYTDRINDGTIKADRLPAGVRTRSFYRPVQKPDRRRGHGPGSRPHTEPAELAHTSKGTAARP